ncbi:MAG: type IV pilus modification protein PilV [Pseudomonadota bacterium]
MSHSHVQRGAAMMEVLIAMLIIAFGILGFVGLQAQTALSQVEGYQRSQALILINDISARMALNRSNAAAYVATDIGTTNPGNCAIAATQAARDLCEWSLLIQGSAEVQGTAKLGAMMGARGCISSPAANQYLISVAWQGVQATGAPASTCGQNAYSSENMRRAATTVLQIATLAL